MVLEGWENVVTFLPSRLDVACFCMMSVALLPGDIPPRLQGGNGPPPTFFNTFLFFWWQTEIETVQM